MNRQKKFWPTGKIVFIFGIFLAYLLLGLAFQLLVVNGVIEKSPPTQVEKSMTDSIAESEKSSIMDLKSLQSSFEKNFVRKNGHVVLYISANKSLNIIDSNTNSEAVSYYLLWNANAKNKVAFDRELDFIESKMTEPNFGYLRWRLASNDSVEGDGGNIASDADLRAIKALLVAEKQWNDPRYKKLAEKLAFGIEKVAITKDNMLAPYGGASGKTSAWSAKEVWISYEDFTVLSELAQRRGDVWKKVYKNMKNATLHAQIHNGLYNSELTEKREYGNGIDGGDYSINSLWMMVRSAESSDTELRDSARKSLEFYKHRFEIDNDIYASYNSEGNALSPSSTPWVYALVGRAAVALDEQEFSEKMIKKLAHYQIKDNKS